MQKLTAIALTLNLLVGCSGADARSPCTATEDICTLQSFKADSPETVDQAVVGVSRVQDPIVRVAAVTHWLGTHPRTTPTQADRLCAVLTPTEQKICSRRANSPHLHR